MWQGWDRDEVEEREVLTRLKSRRREIETETEGVVRWGVAEGLGLAGKLGYDENVLVWFGG